MQIGWARALGWLLVYVLLVLAPMALVLGFGRPEPRGFIVELGAMLGLTGLGVLSTQLVISGRHRWFAGGLGQDNLLQFHRQVGLFGWLLVFAHPVTMFLGDAAYLEFLDPRVDALRAVPLILVLLAVSFLIISSLWREALKLSYEWWRTIHASLALLVVSTGLVHALQGDHYTAGIATKVCLTLLVAFPLLLLFEARLFRPWRNTKRPWTVTEVVQEGSDATRLVLEAKGHPGMPFKPGQYTWLTLGDSPFSLQQHPFSMSSSANDERRIELTAKHAGDFTSGLAQVRPGSLAWLEGPYGAFSMNIAAGRQAVFIAGGIGITPIISTLRTCSERGAQQKLWLIYANQDEPSILFRDRLDELARMLRLKVVLVLSEAGEDWTGEKGFVDEQMLGRVLPPDDESIDYFVCGPPPMMNQVEKALKTRGTSTQRLFSERFNLV